MLNEIAHLVANVEIRGLLGAVDPEIVPGLRVERSRVEGSNDPGLRPWSTELVSPENNDIYNRAKRQSSVPRLTLSDFSKTHCSGDIPSCGS